MQYMTRNWRLALVAFLLLSPAAFAVQNGSDLKRGTPIRSRDFQTFTVPEGNSQLTYLLAAGATCLVAIGIRTRLAKSKA